MNKKDVEKVGDKKFHVALIVSAYLLLDVILLFVLCLIEIFLKVDHNILLAVNIILEVIASFIVTYKGNLRSAIIFYVLLLVSPAFLNVIAMSMIYITDKLPFTPVILLLFRTGYDLAGVMLSKFIRLVLFFRLPALITILLTALTINIKRFLKE